MATKGAKPLVFANNVAPIFEFHFEVSTTIFRRTDTIKLTIVIEF
jgi:hypothetical protein